MDWLDADGYTIGRLLVTRGLAAIYLVAFLAALLQFRALIGAHGILPVPAFVRAVPFRRSPSLFHWRYSDRLFAAVATAGAVLALLTLVGVTEQLPLAACMLVWFALWVLYLSIVNVGQVWYSFGWESLLLEAGVLAIFLGNADTSPQFAVLLLVRWLLFRLEFGAGLIKWRGDRCWRDLTCLYYHHETQPMPGPFSRHFHHLPRPLHRIEVAGNHFTQLVVPFGLFAPQPVAGIAAGIMIVTQLWLVLSGNFAWLNWITIVLGLSVLPDEFYGWIVVPMAEYGPTPEPFVAAVLSLTAAVAVLSYWPVRNMLSHRQAMNASFNRWHFVNTYGAFGSVTRTRREVIVEGTADAVSTPATEWREYEFKGKPGDVHRRPRQYAPYHLRLDWMMWFAGISRDYAAGWFPRFVRKLLENDRDTLKLLRHNPFPDKPPARIRARLFRYRYTTHAEHRATGAWWVRDSLGDFMMPVSRSDVRAR
ncbi:lipase maturation factor family protein [Rhodococcus chondri]|uniref:Lipase maturation factor family protein n=1 Tax=Rhodococcus chondri TaxID=3065941 RepID=A0ABU7JZ10_9NOCA|nr:lipase maturation factor family protein [Rhodococcus sp. CC-R104]MEE2034542.1 lipase maturation factor family protein [Rhodococcus sp. CC-R104]